MTCKDGKTQGWETTKGGRAGQGQTGQGRAGQGRDNQKQGKTYQRCHIASLGCCSLPDALACCLAAHSAVAGKSSWCTYAYTYARNCAQHSTETLDRQARTNTDMADLLNQLSSADTQTQAQTYSCHSAQHLPESILAVKCSHSLRCAARHATSAVSSQLPCALEALNPS